MFLEALYLILDDIRVAITDEAAKILGEESKVVQPEKGEKVELRGRRTFGELRKKLRSKINKGEEYFIIENTLDSVFHTDWSLNLLPPDLLPLANKYFERKYIELGGDKFTPGVSFIVVKRPDGTIINLLDNFLVENEIPTQISLNIGGDVTVKSQFAMNPEESILVTSDQRDDLQRYIKWRREWTESDGIQKKSDWLGFLLMTPLTSENISTIDIDRVLLTKEDLEKAPESVVLGKKTRSQLRGGDVTYATDKD